MITLFLQKCTAAAAISWSLASPGLPATFAATDVPNSVSLKDWSDERLASQVKDDAGPLGSLSVGYPNNGRLFNGVQPEEGELFELVAEDFAWGTTETVAYLQAAVEHVQSQYPDTLPLHVGHISKPSGGYLSPHLSHQSGRDADVGFYYKAKRTWYRRGTNATLDVARTWSLVRAFITETDVELVLIDRSIQALLRSHAEKIGENKDWLNEVFGGSPGRPAIIRHARGHATHIHVRFFSPQAQVNAQRAYPFLVKNNLIEPVHVYTYHKVRKGETLGRIAKRYGTSVKDIQRANGLRGTLIQAKKTYKIPKRGGPSPVSGDLAFPPRLLPPPSGAQKSALLR